MRIYFDADCLDSDAYALSDSGEFCFAKDAVIRSIERRTGQSCYCQRAESWNDSAVTVAATFVGPRTRDGGYPVRFETRIAIWRNQT